MSKSAGAKQQEKPGSDVRPPRRRVLQNQPAAIWRSAAANEVAEDHPKDSGTLQQRTAVRRPSGGVLPAAADPAGAYPESRFAHDFSRVRTHTAPASTGPVISTRTPPSTVAREWSPDVALVDPITVSYDPETNQVRIRGTGAADFLSEHTVPGGAGPAGVPQDGYLIVDVSRLNTEGQTAISTVLRVDRRILLGQREYRPFSGAPDNLDSPLLVDGEWDGARILNNLTQVDRDPNTLFDESRCGPNSALAIHIMSGFDAVANVVAGIRDRVNSIRARAQGVNDAELVRAARAMMQAIDIFGGGRQENARYRHLDLVADALYLVVNERSVMESRAAGQSAGTNVEDMDRLSEAGHGRADPTWANRWAQMIGSGAVHGRTAVSALPAAGERFGMGALGPVVSSLRELRLMSLIVAVPARPQQAVSAGGGGEQYLQEGATNHYIMLGVNADGRVFVYDPYPRTGNQLIWVDGNRGQLESYFLGRWVIEGRMAAASTSAGRPATPQAPDSQNPGTLARYWALGVFQGLGILEIGDGQIRVNRAEARETHGATPTSLNTAYYLEYSRMLAEYNVLFRSGEGSTPVAALQAGSDGAQLVQGGSGPNSWQVRSSVWGLVRAAQEAGWPRTVSAARAGE